MRSDIAFTVQHYEDALAAGRRALEIEPGRVEIWRNQARALWALGRDVEAKEAEQRVSELEGVETSY